MADAKRRDAYDRFAPITLMLSAWTMKRPLKLSEAHPFARPAGLPGVKIEADNIEDLKVFLEKGRGR